MMGVTHIANTTAILSIPLLCGYPLDTTYLVFSGLIVLGSILPDIDEPNSYIGTRLIFLSYPINLLFGHRTITHNFIFVAILCILSYLYNNVYCLAITIGMFIHIFQDSLTYQGIKGCFFPFSKYDYNFVLLPRVFRFAVGSNKEFVILALSIIFTIFAIFNTIRI